MHMVYTTAEADELPAQVVALAIDAVTDRRETVGGQETRRRPSRLLPEGGRQCLNNIHIF
jgi:hypothetical protein